jgi:hypothetical protein
MREILDYNAMNLGNCIHPSENLSNLAVWINRTSEDHLQPRDADCGTIKAICENIVIYCSDLVFTTLNLGLLIL